MRNRTFRGQPPSSLIVVSHYLPLSFLHIHPLLPYHQISPSITRLYGGLICCISVNASIISHLWRCAGGQASAEFSDPSCSCGVGGADQNRAADLHGVSLGWRGQARLMGHSQGGEGVSLLTVLLLPRSFLGAVGLGARGRGRWPFTGITSTFGWLIQFYELSSCSVKLKEEERVNKNNTLLHILLLLYLILAFRKHCKTDSNQQSPYEQCVTWINC